MSLAWSPDYLVSHWRAYEEGAEASGKTPDRSKWRIGCEMYVAETDAQASKNVLNGSVGESWRNYMLPLLAKLKVLGACKHDQSVPDSDVTVEYLIDNVWAVGSPQTVIEKIGRLKQQSRRLRLSAPCRLRPHRRDDALSRILAGAEDRSASEDLTRALAASRNAHGRRQRSFAAIKNKTKTRGRKS